MAKKLALVAELELLLQECNEFTGQYEQLTINKEKSNQLQQYFDVLQDIIPALKKITTENKIVISEPNAALEDAIVDPFEMLLKDYNEACAAGTLTKKLANKLLTALKDVIRKQVEVHNDLSKVYKKSKDKLLKQQLQESAQLIRVRKATLEALDTSCVKGEVKIIIETPFEDLMLVSEIDQIYEEVIEQGIKMSTGPSPDIALSYKEAIDQFVELYKGASDGLKSKWKQAKKEVDRNAALLKEKMGKADDTVEGFKNQMRATGIRGYFRYAEGVVNGALIRRLDWVMSSTGAFVSNWNGDGNAGQDGEIIIENYELTGNGQGDLVYTHKGKVTKLTSRIFELASMLNAPFYKDEQSYDMKPGVGQAFSGNQAGADQNSSIMLRTTAKPQPTVVEIPDWTDGKIQELIDTYNRRCAAGMPNREARNRKGAMLKEIEVHQGALIKELETIHEAQGERKDTAILLSIWRKKKEMWENEASSLGAGCVQPTNPSGEPVNVQDLVDKFLSVVGSCCLILRLVI